jgi:hypothetical protein
MVTMISAGAAPAGPPSAADAGSAFNASRPKSAASWGAIIAGALVAAGMSLILLALGSGLGFASMSPWAGHGIGAGTFTVAAAIWLIVMQWVSSIFGGYITGRLRTRWIGTHTHEIFFRDTANGLVMWALSTVVVATLLASSASSGLSGGVKAVSGVVSAGMQGAAQGASATEGGSSEGGSSALAYGIDKLFRAGTASSAPGAAAAGGPGSTVMRDPRMETRRILVNGLATGGVPDADRTYLAGLVAAQAGVSEADAQRRVDELIAAANDAETKVKAAADMARKDAAEVSIYTALSLLIGAFIASVSAALGGRLRDEHV